MAIEAKNTNLMEQSFRIWNSSWLVIEHEGHSERYTLEWEQDPNIGASGSDLALVVGRDEGVCCLDILVERRHEGAKPRYQRVVGAERGYLLQLAPVVVVIIIAIDLVVFSEEAL